MKIITISAALISSLVLLAAPLQGQEQDRQSRPTREYQVKRKVIERIATAPSKILAERGVVKAVDDANKPITMVNPKTLAINDKGGTGSVTWVDRRADGSFAVKNWNHQKQPRKIALAKALPTVSHFVIDAASLMNVPDLRQGTYRAGVEGKNVAVEQLIIGGLPEFPEQLNYNVQLADGSQRELSGSDVASLMVTLFGGTQQDDCYWFTSRHADVQAGKVHDRYLNMMDFDNLWEGANYPGDCFLTEEAKDKLRESRDKSAEPLLAYKANIPGGLWTTKKLEGWKGYRAHILADDGKSPVYSDLFYANSLRLTLPAAGRDQRVIVALARSHAIKGAPSELVRFEVPHKALATRGNLVILTNLSQQPIVAMALRAF